MSRTTAHAVSFLHRCVLYNDDLLMVLNKPNGLAVHGGTKTWDHLSTYLPLLNQTFTRLPQPAHRIDKAASGLLLLYRDRRFGKFLMHLFSDKSHSSLQSISSSSSSSKQPTQSLEKRYTVVVIGRPPNATGIVRSPIMSEQGEVKEAVSTYQLIRTLGDQLSMMWMSPLTGRKRQLRLHALHLGCPILSPKGDEKTTHAPASLSWIEPALKLANKAQDNSRSISDQDNHVQHNPFCPPSQFPLFLHCDSMSFSVPKFALSKVAPNHATMHFTAPLPPHFQRLLAMFGEK